MYIDSNKILVSYHVLPLAHIHIPSEDVEKGVGPSSLVLPLS